MEGYAHLSRGAAPSAESQHRDKSQLTPREAEGFQLLVQGAGNREIADQLYLSNKTGRQHGTTILRKLGVRSRSEAVIHSVCSGVVK